MTNPITILLAWSDFDLFNHQITKSPFIMPLPTRYAKVKAFVTVLFVLLLGTPYYLVRVYTSSESSVPSDRYGFYLSDVTEQMQVNFVHQKPRFDPKLNNIMPHIAALGASVAITDMDNDGWQDIYVTSSRQGAANALYINRQNGTFENIADSIGLAAVNEPGTGVSMGSIWGDYDNDGYEDVFIYQWGFQRLFHNNGDRTFSDVTEASGLRRWMNATCAVWLDADRDGLLDLYIGGYFSEAHNLWQVTTTRIMQESFEYAENGGHNYLFLNRGGGRFEDMTQAYQADCTRWTMSVGAVDLNGDGWQDLYLANDYGPEVLLINQKGQRFEQLVGTTLEETSKSGMNVAFGDLFNDGKHDVYITNISKRGYLFQGNNLRRNLLDETGQMLNIADGETSDAGWAWGAQFGDLNNDGHTDLFVTNGFVSADPDEDYWYEMSRVAMGNNNIFQDVENWALMGDQSLSGYERSRLYLNDGAGRMFDVAEAVGITDRYDGRGVAFVDLMNRGVLDLVVASQNAPLKIYKNTLTTDHAWVAFELVGVDSNARAVGAEVCVYWNGHQQVQVVTGGSGFASQSQRRLHFGLGDSQRLDRVEIRWPNGKTQALKGLALNTLHRITEATNR